MKAIIIAVSEHCTGGEWTAEEKAVIAASPALSNFYEEEFDDCSTELYNHITDTAARNAFCKMYGLGQIGALERREVGFHKGCMLFEALAVAKNWPRSNGDWSSYGIGDADYMEEFVHTGTHEVLFYKHRVAGDCDTTYFTLD